MKQNKFFVNFREKLRKNQFAIFLIGVISITIVSTVIGLKVYTQSGMIKLDLSRPGYEKLRKEVQKSNIEQPFLSSGDLDKDSINDFNSRMDKIQEDLNSSGNFGGADNLSDKSIGL